MPLFRDCRQDLIADLHDPREVAEYINAALEDDDSAVVANASRNVIEALALPAHGRKQRHCAVSRTTLVLLVFV